MANNISRLLTGIGLLVLGIIFFVLALFDSFWLFFYAIPFIIIGVWIFFNDGEDKIEKIKYKGGKK
ncbi:hypothetical protein HOA59_03005 [archaeon]|jgi:hypothetical protein|nr:hypothetical protein [archaeon]MBT6824379.1 hypothetical protein [archaeon]MBT7106929.1 hypothetical protein [archaeon]MBT7297482.1 hypothetical protein [archaeon]